VEPVDIPFRLSNSADDADPDARLSIGSMFRRLSGHVALDDDALVFEVDALPAGGKGVVRVAYRDLASAVLRPGILTSRIRITARDERTFAALTPRNPREATLLVGRKFRRDARSFVALLQIRLAEANAARRPPRP
jgi:hypothetical protein